MLLTLTDLLIERKEAGKKYFQNYRYFASLIKKEAEKVLGQARVFVFGSILRKKEIPQDIDILVISPALKTPEKKSRLRTEIFRRFGFSYPFEIHLITPKEYRGWYGHFIKEKKEIK